MSQFVTMDVIERLSDSALSSAYSFVRDEWSLSGLKVTDWGGIGLDMSVSRSALDAEYFFRMTPSALLYFSLFWEVDISVDLQTDQSSNSSYGVNLSINRWF